MWKPVWASTFFFILDRLDISLECVLHCHGWVEVESTCSAIGRPDKVVAQFKLSTNAQLVVLTILANNIEPELRLREEDQPLV